MDELISRQAAIDALNEYFCRISKLKRRGLNKGEKAISLDVAGAIQSLPTKVICCKDCKFAYMTADGECKYCDIWFPDEKTYMPGDYFCGSAERKGDSDG